MSDERPLDPPTQVELALRKLEAILKSLGGPVGAHAAGPAGAPPAAAAAAAAAAATVASPSAAAAAATPAAAGQQGGVDPAARATLAAKVCIKVARLVAVERLEGSDKLLRCQADLGGGDTRQILAGLQAFYAPEDLQGRLVCVAANLKPAKLAGQPSEAMVMAAEAELPAGLAVRVLEPPAGSEPGDMVHMEGSPPPEKGYPKKISSEWRQVAASGGLVVRGGCATFDGTPLVTAQGVVTVPPEVADGAGIR